MAQYKGTLFFIGPGQGWTESYGMKDSTPAGAISQLLDVAAARSHILHTNLLIQDGRISDVAIKGDSTPALGEAIIGTAVDTAGYLDLDVALMTKWQVGVFSRNKTFVRGIPVGQTIDGDIFMTGPFATSYANWVDAIIANCLMYAQTSPPVPPPPFPKSWQVILAGAAAPGLHRRKTGRPFGQPRGRRVTP